MRGTFETKPDFPSLSQLRAELEREKYRKSYAAMLRSTICTLIVVAAVAVLVSTIWMPVLRIYGSSMTPTVNEGELVVCVKTSNFRSGDLTAFYLGNKILVKRCIAGPGQWVDIDESGIVSIDGIPWRSHIWQNTLWGSAIWISPIRCRRAGGSAWETIGPPRWIHAIPRWGVWLRNRWWARLYFGSGHCLNLVR